MKNQQILIVILIAIESASIHLMSRTKLFPLIAVVVALSSFVIQKRVSLDKKTGQRLFALLVLVFCVKHMVYRPPMFSWRISIGSPGCLTTAQFIMTLQLCFLFIKTKQGYY